MKLYEKPSKDSMMNLETKKSSVSDQLRSESNYLAPLETMQSVNQWLQQQPDPSRCSAIVKEEPSEYDATSALHQEGLKAVNLVENSVANEKKSHEVVVKPEPVEPSVICIDIGSESEETESTSQTAGPFSSGFYDVHSINTVRNFDYEEPNARRRGSSEIHLPSEPNLIGKKQRRKLTSDLPLQPVVSQITAEPCSYPGFEPISPNDFLMMQKCNQVFKMSQSHREYVSHQWPCFALDYLSKNYQGLSYKCISSCQFGDVKTYTLIPAKGHSSFPTIVAFGEWEIFFGFV